MKSLMVVILVAVTGLNVLAQTAAEKPLTLEEKKERLARMQAEMKKMSPEERHAFSEKMKMQKFGGFVDNLAEQRGLVLFVNAQKAAPMSIYDGPKTAMGKIFNIKLRVDQADRSPAMDEIEMFASVNNANVCVVVVDDPKLPMSLLAPEGHWAYLNVHQLLADKPDEKLLVKRFSQQFWRVFSLLAGAGDSAYEGCILAPARDVRELDGIPAYLISPEPVKRMLAHLKKIGVTPARRATYRKACEEGWAPMPTNEWQRAVLERVRAAK